ncbi:MAG: hypothetical protein JWM16_868 [Verrucomicrobiales bacterium]|nr:hypothetical protein [Verrucomicrobiales bacterium]
MRMNLFKNPIVNSMVMTRYCLSGEIFTGIKEWIAILTLTASILFISGCKQKAVDSSILAKVGSREIRLEDFKTEVEWRIKNHRPLPDRRELLDEMIARELLLQKARAEGLENDPDVRHSYESLLAGKLRDRMLTPRVEALKVSSEEVQSLYKKELARNTQSAKAHLALVCIKTDSKMSSEKRAEAEKRIQEARQFALGLPSSTRGFGQIAMDYSEDQASRYKGGDVGWFDENQTAYRWPSEVVAAGFGLKTNGAISEVIAAANGFYLVTKLDARESVATPLGQLQASLQRRLLTEKRQQTETAFRQELRDAAPVQSFPQALGEVNYPATAVAKAEELAPPTLPRSP